MEEIKRIRLMPEVYLTCIQTRKFKCSQWYLGLAVPLTSKEASLNALLPRVLRQGTADLSDSQALSRRLEELYGGSIEPVVNKRGEVQWLGFWGSFLDEALVPSDCPILDEAARLMGDLLLRPATRNGRLRGDYVEREKQHLIEDIQRSVNDKAYYAMQRAIEKMCAGEAYRVGRLGTLSEAKRLSVARLTRHYHSLLSEATVELYYAGSAAPERVERAWREALRGLPRERTLRQGGTDWLIQPGVPRRFSETMELRQARLVLGYRTLCSVNSPHFPALMAANALLGGGAASRLFATVREQLSLCYAIHSTLDRHKGLLLIQAGVANDGVERAEEEILRQIEALRQGQFEAEELQSAVRSVAGQYRRLGDSQLLQADYWLSQTQVELRVSPDELADRLEAVTKEQVVEALNRLTLDSVYSLRGPAEEEVTQQ